MASFLKMTAILVIKTRIYYLLFRRDICETWYVMIRTRIDDNAIVLGKKFHELAAGLSVTLACSISLSGLFLLIRYLDIYIIVLQQYTKVNNKQSSWISKVFT
jgi:hypothetical protein